MVLKAASRKIVDLRKAPKDIIDGARKGADLGRRIEALGRVGKKFTQLLRSNVLRK